MNLKHNLYAKSVTRKPENELLDRICSDCLASIVHTDGIIGKDDNNTTNDYIY